MFLADTHLLGEIRGHWLDKLRREWQMERAFQTALWWLQPEVIFILGDIFDEGKWSSPQAWADDVQRFQKIFRHPHHVQLKVIVGNHDIGFHYQMNRYLVKRFEKVFNSKRLFSWKGVNFVMVNSVALEGDGCDICSQAEAELIGISRKLNCSREVQGSGQCGGQQKLKQLQASCIYEHITPEEKFLGWFRDLERLSEEASYDLSCTLEPPGQNDTASPPTKKRFSIWKAWKNHQTQSTAPSTNGSSQLKWMEQDKGGPEMSSTNTTAVQSDSNVQSAPSSSSYPELIRSNSQTSSGDPKKVQGSSSRSTGMTSLASASQSSPTDTSTMDTNSANTHSGTSGQSSDSSSAPPHLRLGDSCVIRVVLPVENRRLCRSIEVTNQEKTRDVIMKAMKKFQVRGYKPEDLELVRILTQDQKLRIPDDANIFYALKTMDIYHVVLRKYTFPQRTPAKQRSSFSLFHRKRRGSKA